MDRPHGAVVVNVAAGGPAEKAGLRVGDVIVAVDGHDVGDPQAALYRFATKGVGSDAALDLVTNGRKRQAKIALIAAPESTPRDTRELDGANPFAGATVANLSPAVAEELSLGDTAGVVIIETKAYSTARRLGLQPGDIIVQLNGTPVRNVRNLAELISQRTKTWDLTIRRGGEEFRTVIRG
jgi:S1-C subfamily serine protease